MLPASMIHYSHTIELREVSLGIPRSVICSSIKNIFSKRKSNRDQQAVESLTIEKGEIVGVLGTMVRKSTLFISRIYLPDKGTVLLNGNVTLLA